MQRRSLKRIALGPDELEADQMQIFASKVCCWRLTLLAHRAIRERKRPQCFNECADIPRACECLVRGLERFDMDTRHWPGECLHHFTRLTAVDVRMVEVTPQERGDCLLNGVDNLGRL